MVCVFIYWTKLIDSVESNFPNVPVGIKLNANEYLETSDKCNDTLWFK